MFPPGGTRWYLMGVAHDAGVGRTEFPTLAGLARASDGVMCFVRMPVVRKKRKR